MLHRCFLFLRCKEPPPSRDHLQQSSLVLKLFLVKPAQPLDGVCFFRSLVVSESRDPCKPQRKSRLVPGTLLNLVVRNLDHNLWFHVNSPFRFCGLQLLKPLGDHVKLCIRQTLERLPYNHVLAGLFVPDCQMVVAQPTDSSPATPFRGDDDYV